MTKSLIGVFGSGGFAREIMPLVRQEATKRSLSGLHVSVAFVTREGGDDVNGIACISERAFFNFEGERLYSIGIGDRHTRQLIDSVCTDNGADAITICASGAVMYDCNTIGQGAVIAENCIITSNVGIGRHFHMNIFSYIAHDCLIGDFVTFAPAVKCNGNVTIEDGAYLGTGAIIRQGTPNDPLVIGRDAVVGAGAVVTRSVPAGATIVGNPARNLRQSGS